MKRLSKIHKQEIPLGPITSGIESAPHRLAKILAKSLSSALGNISGAMNAIKEALKTIDESSLPICKRDYMQLTEKCMRFGSFRFGNQEYQQLEGLPMGSPLSAMTVNLYLEVLERDNFLKVLPKGVHWLRYVDDCLFISPTETVAEEVLSKLNEVTNNIQFTMEIESLGLPTKTTYYIFTRHMTNEPKQEW
ncbi:uncharacterized protein LOC143037319 [Oratosquilla oratoria]|uniref:uncharacterized protein LOC143037319 n=1 Tax=Oratosquilla oratoria TaxID=337810 RepID=UPI003F7721BE